MTDFLDTTGPAPQAGPVECVRRLAALAVLAGRRGEQFDWPAVEASIHRRLPNDYKELLATFPDGTFGGLIHLNRPGEDGHPRTEFLGYYGFRLDDMREWREGGYGSFPYPIFPEPEGVLPWASGPRGEVICWLTEDEDPERWPVVVPDADFTQWHQFPRSACEFLVELVTGRFDTSVFGVGKGAREVFTPKSAAGAPAELSKEDKQVRFLGEGRARSEFPELITMLGRPENAPPPVDWRQVEQQLGLVLPTDFKSFMDMYGQGRFCDITIEADLVDLAERRYRWVRDDIRPHFDPLVYPEPGGVIPWGTTADGWTLWWAQNDPDPNLWGVAVIEPELRMVEYRPDLSFSAFLVRYPNPATQNEMIAGRDPWRRGPRFIPRT